MIMMYLRAVRLGKEEHETLREYSTRIDKRLQIVQKNLGDYVEVFEEAFYDEKIPEVVEIEAVEAFFSRSEVNGKTKASAIQVSKASARRVFYIA